MTSVDCRALLETRHVNEVVLFSSRLRSIRFMIIIARVAEEVWLVVSVAPSSRLAAAARVWVMSLLSSVCWHSNCTLFTFFIIVAGVFERTFEDTNESVALVFFLLSKLFYTVFNSVTTFLRNQTRLRRVNSHWFRAISTNVMDNAALGSIVFDHFIVHCQASIVSIVRSIDFLFCFSANTSFYWVFKLELHFCERFSALNQKSVFLHQ